MATKAIIVCTNEGQTIPEEYLKQVFEECGPKEGAHSMLGIAFANEGKVEYLRDYTSLSKTTTDTLKDLTAEMKSRAVFYFCRSDNPILEEDMQPFSLIEDGDKSTLMAFCEGVFPNYEQGNNAHQPEYFVINDYLLEKLADIYEKQSSLENTLKVMDTPIFRKEMTNLFIPRGCITMITGEGQIMSFIKSTNVGSFPWGWTSDKMSYFEGGKKVEEPAKEDKIAALKAKLAGKASTVADKPSVPLVKEAPTDTKIPDPVKVEDVEKMIPIPAAAMRSNKELKKWWKRNVAFMPSNWKDLKEVSSKHIKTSSAYHEKKDFKDLTPETVVEASKGIATEVSLIISPSHQKTLMEKFIKQLTPGNDKLLTQEKITALEENFPTFSEQTEDYPIKTFCLWPVERISAMVKECGTNTAVAAINDLRYLLLEAHPEWMKEQPKEEDKKPAAPVDKIAELKARLAARKAM